MVDYNGLENRRAERHRGFESLSLREISNLRVAFFVYASWVRTILSVASLCDSAHMGRVRIPLSARKQTTR